MKPIRDFWDPAFETGAAVEAAEVQGCADDPWCIGVHTDNELPWSLSFVQSTTFLNAYMTLPAGVPGKVALQAHLSDRYEGDIAAFNAAWGTHLADFDDLQNLDAIGIPGPLGRIFETAAQRADRKSFVDEASPRYHCVVHDAIRADAPDAPVLGSRFISVMTPLSVMAARRAVCRRPLDQQLPPTATSSCPNSSRSWTSFSRTRASVSSTTQGATSTPSTTPRPTRS